MMMTRHTRSSSALLSVAVAVFAFVLFAEAAFEKGHVHLPFTRVGKAPRLSNRDAADAPAAIPLGNKFLPYQVEVEVGTPPQKMYLAITTTTGFTWLQDGRESMCRPGQEVEYPNAANGDYSNPMYVERPSACQSGAFNKSDSSTFLNANQAFGSFSVDTFPRLGVYGINMTDTLVLGGLEFPNLPMGLATIASETYTGVLGLGYPSAYRYEDGAYPNYPGFMDYMLEGGHTTTRAFSIWLDDADDVESGHLLFGAIDQSSYQGDLVRMKADVDYAYHGTFGVTADGLEAAGDSDSELEAVETHDFPLGLTISPSETFSYLPEALFKKIVALTGASYNVSTQYTTIACDAAEKNSARFAMRLGGPDGPLVNFETSDLVIPRETFSYYGYFFRKEVNVCLFALQSAGNLYDGGSEYYSLGSGLLRRSYLVFDVENFEVAVAPVKTKSTSDQSSPTIVAFASSGAPVPSASLYCAAGDWNCQDYCGEESCSTPLPIPTETGDSRYPPSDYGGPRSGYFPSDGEATYWRNVAIGVGVSLGATALIAGIAITIIWGRICRGTGYNSAKADVEDRTSEETVAALGPVMSAPRAMGTRMQSSPVIISPGTLPVIREEGSGSRAPQLPVFETAGPITPPEPLSPSNRDSVAVSAVSSEDVHDPDSTAAVPAVAATAPDGPSKSLPAAATTASDAESPLEPPRSPKGKGVERAEPREV
ncbi:aspartic proteinase yapsin-3 [Rhypophila decipiens]|uniref:Aspartic proteinase yapsin-3 n=1 Tax=Rhypophila decipiens TaxID=261697 RepID=A0AAN7B674_9PEZI|nr:aspartic proteinase yapsin-3 [Rhypophila decipiens]